MDAPERKLTSIQTPLHYYKHIWAIRGALLSVPSRAARTYGSWVMPDSAATHGYDETRAPRTLLTHRHASTPR
ncbi:hypothetical protein VTO73DRAFT_2819 [Trametes versicolor]